MVRCAPRARLLLLAGLLSAAAAPGRAAFTDVFQLPSQTFQLVAPQWLWAGHGFVNDTAAVYWTGVTGSLCDCTTRCFVDVGCLSLSYDTSSGACQLNAVRGHPSNTEHRSGTLHRLRPQMAVLGDWCSADSDCSLLTSGAGRCVANTCQCAPGEQPVSPTQCGPATLTTTEVATVGSTATGGPDLTSTAGPSGSSTAAAVSSTASTTPTAPVASSTTETAAPPTTAVSSSTAPTTATTTPTAATSTSTESTTSTATSTTNGPSTTPTYSTASTTVTTTTETTAAISTTLATTTTTATAATTTATAATTTATATTTTATAATTAAITTTAVATTTPTTMTSTTTTPTTTQTTTPTTTQTTTPTTTVPTIGEPVTTGMEPLGTPILVEGSTAGQDLNAWVCGSHTSGTSALIGATAGGGQGNQLNAMQCADFSTLPGFTMDHSNPYHLILSEPGAACPDNSVIIAIQDSETNANTAIEALCVTIGGGYVVDHGQSSTRTFVKDVPLSCDPYYAVTALARDPTNKDPWTTMRCCKIVPE